jgi:hypothetical protein
VGGAEDQAETSIFRVFAVPLPFSTRRFQLHMKALISVTIKFK